MLDYRKANRTSIDIKRQRRIRNKHEQKIDQQTWRINKQIELEREKKRMVLKEKKRERIGNVFFVVSCVTLFVCN